MMSLTVGNLSMVSWNVRGLGDPNKCALIKDTLCSYRVSPICL
jgi:hypothetical protein